MSRRIVPFWRAGLAFCPACHEPLSTEEIGWECCDACDGTGQLSDDEPDPDQDFDDIDFEDPTP